MNWKTLVLVLFCFCGSTLHAATLVDSIGIEINDKDTVILHAVSKGESFYSIARKYHVGFQALMSFNNASGSSLTVGQTLRIPKSVKPAVPVTIGPPVSTANEPKPKQKIPQLLLDLLKKDVKDSIKGSKYIVKKGDYLYSIAKLKNVNIQDIKHANNLRSNNLKIGQELIIPDKKMMRIAKDTIKEEEKIDTTTKIRSTAHFVKSVREIHETGVANWIKTDATGASGRSFALHRTAPLGTIIKVTNTMNNKSVLVKVIGPLPDTGENENIIIKLSATAAKMLGVINDKFQASLHYAVPKE